MFFNLKSDVSAEIRVEQDKGTEIMTTGETFPLDLDTISEQAFLETPENKNAIVVQSSKKRDVPSPDLKSPKEEYENLNSSSKNQEESEEEQTNPSKLQKIESECKSHVQQDTNEKEDDDETKESVKYLNENIDDKQEEEESQTVEEVTKIMEPVIPISENLLNFTNEYNNAHAYTQEEEEIKESEMMDYGYMAQQQLKNKSNLITFFFKINYCKKN